MPRAAEVVDAGVMESSGSGRYPGQAPVPFAFSVGLPSSTSCAPRSPTGFTPTCAIAPPMSCVRTWWNAGFSRSEFHYSRQDALAPCQLATRGLNQACARRPMAVQKLARRLLLRSAAGAELISAATSAALERGAKDSPKAGIASQPRAISRSGAVAGKAGIALQPRSAGAT